MSPIPDSKKNKNWIDGYGDSDVGNIVMLVTLWWWLISDVAGRIIMLVIFPMFQIGHQHPESLTNISNFV